MCFKSLGHRRRHGICTVQGRSCTHPGTHRKGDECKQAITSIHACLRADWGHCSMTRGTLARHEPDHPCLRCCKDRHMRLHWIYTQHGSTGHPAGLVRHDRLAAVDAISAAGHRPANEQLQQLGGEALHDWEPLQRLHKDWRIAGANRNELPVGLVGPSTKIVRRKRHLRGKSKALLSVL